MEQNQKKQELINSRTSIEIAEDNLKLTYDLYNPNKYLQKAEVISKLDVSKNAKLAFFGHKTIRYYKRTNIAKLEKTLGLIVIDFVECLANTNQLTEHQINELLAQLINVYNDLLIEDVMLFFNRLKTGKYGKLIKPDVPTIMANLQKYYEEREDFLIDMREAEHNKIKWGNDSPITKESVSNKHNDEEYRSFKINLLIKQQNDNSRTTNKTE